MILDGKKVANLRNEQLKAKIKTNKLKLTTAIILVGDNPASLSYVNGKLRACKKVGIEARLIKLDESITKDELTNEINKLNEDKSVDGILLQLPLPNHLVGKHFINLINPKKDIDGFTTINQGKLFQEIETIPPATPQGIMNLIDHYNINLEGMDVLVIGRSQIVGLPVAKMILDRNATVTVCHLKSKDWRIYSKNADLIVVAAGHPKLLTADLVKEGVIVVDVGINRVDGKIVGDVDFEAVAKKAKYISPVPKGIGPMTINALLENVYKVKMEGN